MILALVWLVASGAVLVVAGSVVTVAADVIAERTKLGRLFVGTLLLATVTSLPELVTDIAAVRLGTPDLAAGDLFGSSMSNMVILAVLNIIPPRGQIFRRAAFDHLLTGALAIVVNALAAVLVLARPGFVILGVSPGSLLIFFVFLVGMRGIYGQAKREPSAAGVAGVPAPPGTAALHGLTLRSAVIRLASAGAVIFVAAPLFAAAAQRTAELSGLGATFVGTWLVGAATSAPELVSCLAALRLGAFDLAVGNLLGSNSFNMVVFLAMDLAQPGGSIFSAISPSHAVSALVAIVLMSLALAAIVQRAERRFAVLEPGSGLIFLTYAAGLWLLYRLSGPHP